MLSNFSSLGMFHLTHHERHAPLFAHVCKRLFEPLFQFAHAEQVVWSHTNVDIGGSIRIVAVANGLAFDVVEASVACASKQPALQRSLDYDVVAVFP